MPEKRVSDLFPVKQTIPRVLEDLAKKRKAAAERTVKKGKENK